MEKSSSFWDKNWRTILVVVSVASVVGGASYLLLSSSPPKGRPESKKARRSANKEKKGGNALKAAEAAESDANQPSVSDTTDAEASYQELFPPDLTVLSEEARSELSQKAKTVGNKLFGEKKYEEAIKFYSQAINLKEDAVFYANRAACAANLNRHEDVINDCNSALGLDSRYVKALYRRAQAYASVLNYEKALLDYTAICMLEEFKKEASIAATDRILKEIGKQKTEDIWRSKVPHLPSETFVTAYMDSFRETANAAIKIQELTPESEADSFVISSSRALTERKWTEAMDLVMDALRSDSEISPPFKAYALNMAGTFAFLRGEVSRAESLLDEVLVINPSDTNALIKKASLCMEKGDIEKALKNYDLAEQLDSNNADGYVAGQVKFLTGDLSAAISDYKRSLAIDNGFVYAHIQLGVAIYKSGEPSQATTAFEKARRKFPKSPEIYNYFGELLIDQQSFEEALKNFDKSIEINPKSPLPYINKSILFLQWKKDPKSAEELCRKALEIDPLCDIAYIQLAQLLIQQNDFSAAITCYDEAAASAQQHTSQLYPDIYAKLRAFA
ncbi:TOM (translocase of outer membrane) complex component [Dinochytrium kinnereticum]|nr:TOM (translocase of outer membrane) complex component [Dinochytrium kinnereticum]